MRDDRFPCLIFSQDGRLCDERDIVSSCDELRTRGAVEARFFRSLYGDAPDFRSFCADGGDNGYRIYHIRCFSSDNRYRYAFCEKAELLGEKITAVYLARTASALYPLMSPSSPTITSSLVVIKYAAEVGETRLSAEAFSVVERIPYLAESLFSKNASAKYCDLTDFTKAVVRRLAESENRGTAISVSSRPGICGGCIIEFPTDAYTAVLSIICSVEAALSSDHMIDITVSYYSYAADVSISTVTDRLNESTPLASLGFLKSAGSGEKLLRIADTIASIAGIDLYVCFDGETGKLTVTAGIGYEMQSMPDFKHCDPYERIDSILAELPFIESCE